MDKKKTMKNLLLILFLFVYASTFGQAIFSSGIRIYPVTWFGGVPDGVETNDGAISSGSQTLTCTTCGFTAAAVGKYIIVAKAGSSSAPLITTISAFTNSTTVTLTGTCGTTVTSGGNVIWGTDNTVAIQTAINAQFSAGLGKVWFPYGNSGGMYIIGGALTATTPAGYDVNAQIYIPSNSVFATNSAQRTAVMLEGESVGPQYPSPAAIGAGKFAKTGVIFRSTISGSGILPSVIGSPNVTDGFEGVGSTDGYFKNIWIKVYTNQGAVAPTVSGLNGNYASSTSIYNMAASGDVIPSSSQDPSGKEVCGFIIGRKNDNGPNIVDKCFASGFKYGFVLGEHTRVISLFADCNYYGLCLPKADYGAGGYAMLHWNRIEIYSPTASNTNFLDAQSGEGQSNINFDVEIETLDTLSSTRWYGGRDQPRIADTSNFLHGVVRTTAEMSGGAKDVPMLMVNGSNAIINYWQDNSNWIGSNSLLTFSSTGLRSQYSTTFANLGIGSLRLQSAALNSGGVIGDNAHSSSGTFVYDSTGFAGWFQFFNGSVGWRPAVSGTAGATISVRTSFMLNNDLSFGIGGNSSYGTATGYYLNGTANGLTTAIRLQTAKGAAVASANNLTLGLDGNTFHITGTTTINAITIANWQAGSVIRLIFDGSVTVKNNTAGGGGTAVMKLAGAADFSATADDVLTLVYDGTSWFEQSRSVN